MRGNVNVRERGIHHHHREHHRQMGGVPRSEAKLSSAQQWHRSSQDPRLSTEPPTGSPGGCSSEQCGLAPERMGCSTSMILLQGLRAVLEGNCSYVCQSDAEPSGPEEADWTPSRKESQSRVDLAASVTCVCMCGSLVICL